MLKWSYRKRWLHFLSKIERVNGTQMKRTGFLTSAIGILLALCLTACGGSNGLITTGSSGSASEGQTADVSPKTTASDPVTSENATPTTPSVESSDGTSVPTPGTTATKPVTSGSTSEPVTSKDTPVTSSSTPITSDKTTSSNKPVTTKKPVTTSTPVTSKKPEPQTPAFGTAITIRYIVNDKSAGSLSGSTVQTIYYGQTKTTSVTATAKLGYKFTGWSDGVKTATRSAESFTKSQSLTANFELDGLELPILYLTTKNGAAVTSKDNYMEGTISIYNTDSKYMLENFAMEIRGRGNFTWSSQNPITGKVPYKIKLSEKLNLLGEGNGKAKVWTLLADYYDRSLLRNYTALTFARSMKNITWISAGQSVEVFLNGEYKGVFLLCEQNQVHEKRVNINDDIEAQPSERGYLIEMSNYAAENVFRIGGNGYNGPAYEVKSDLSTNSTLANSQINYITAYLQRCWNAVASGNQATIENLMDIDSVIDCYIVEEVFKNLDAGHDSFYMYKDKGGKLVFGPIWDFDQSGGLADDGCEYYYDVRASKTNEWFRVLLQNDWFKEKLVERWNEVKPEADKIPTIVRTQAKAAFKSYSRNFQRWQIFGYKICRETQPLIVLKNFTEHYEYYATWMANRIEWLDEYWNSPSFNFSGKPTLKGSGTASDPYLVSSPADFLNFTACVLDGQNFSGKYFRQTADIDMSRSVGYSGMGASCTFAGIYDGQGHTINVNISANDNSIFPYLTGKVYNVVATGSITNSTVSAGLCRSVRSSGVLINCASFVDVVSGGSNAGGLSGSNESGGTISNCFFGGTISSPASAGPINIWFGDRQPGVCRTNYYLKGIDCNNFPSWSEVEVTAIEKTAPAANCAIGKLNNGRNVAASAGSVNSSVLCEWIVRDNMPTLKAK